MLAERSNGVILMVLGIHLSVQTEIDIPSPTRFSSPILRALRPAMIARQVAEAERGRLAFMKSTSGEYHPFITLVLRS